MTILNNIEIFIEKYEALILKYNNLEKNNIKIKRFIKYVFELNNLFCASFTDTQLVHLLYKKKLKTVIK